MRIGKVSETVFERTILKQIKVHRNEIKKGAALGEDCALFEAQGKEDIYLSSNSFTLTADKGIVYCIYMSVNDIAASGGEPIGILVNLILPERARETAIKKYMEQTEEICKKMQIQVILSKPQITDAVNRPIFTVSGIGRSRLHNEEISKPLLTSNIQPGLDIVITKWIGLYGTAMMAGEKEEELLTRLPRHLIETAKKFDTHLSIIPEAATAVKSNVCGAHQAGEGGIFGSLWEMAKCADVGLRIDLKKIPIRQETIEICEYFHLNPYTLMSMGALIIAAEDGEELVEKLEQENIHAVVVGRTTADNDRNIINGEEIRFLEPIKTDEIYKI